MRVELIAMSGVRVRDVELAQFGMSLPGFVERGKVIASLPSLSLLTLAGSTPLNWEIRYSEVDGQNLEDFAETIAQRNPNLVAISSFTARIIDTYELANHLRKRGVRVVLGGLHVSALPYEAREYADSVVVGEAENIWPVILQDALENKLKAIYRATDAKEVNFQESPLPRYDLLDLNQYNRITLQTSRGCPHHCDFCGASRTISPYRLKPIDRIRRELDLIVKRWERPFVELADDNTFVSKQWSKELVALLNEYNIRWFTETDISVADDDELLNILADSGCAQLLIGLESPQAEGLKGIDTKNWKLARLERYAEDIARIQNHGISVNGCFILGHDSDDETVFEKVRNFVRDINLSEVQITLKTPFPGTTFRQQMRYQNRLLKDVGWDSYTLFDPTYVPNRMSVADLQSGFRWLMGELYSETETNKRKGLFRKCLKNRTTKNA